MMSHTYFLLLPSHNQHPPSSLLDTAVHGVCEPPGSFPERTVTYPHHKSTGKEIEGALFRQD